MRFSYDALVRLAVTAVTPCIIINTILTLAGVHLPCIGVFFLLVALGYLYFGVKVCAKAIAVEYEQEPQSSEEF